MKKYGLWIVVGLNFLGCVKQNPAVCDGNLSCSDPSRPFCDIDGAVDGSPNACIAVSCTAGEFAACRGDDALTCTASGDNYDLVPCPNGCGAGGCNACVPDTMRCANGKVERCSAGGTFEIADTCVAGCVDGPPHCAYLQPTYMPTICDTPATDDALLITTSSKIDQSIDANCNGGELTQLGNNTPKICVLRYKTINVNAGTTTFFSAADSTAAPNYNPVVALVADGDIHIDGTLDVSGHIGSGQNFGPGANYIDEGRPAALSANGGGGGGGATYGGNGGTSFSDGGANDAGAPTSDPSTRAVFYGAGTGNIGGGGIEIVSCHGNVYVSGTINAGGAGGYGGPFITFGRNGGMGGGTGGNIVLEGIGVFVSGGLYANGGGGGGGLSTGTATFNGSDAYASLACAPGATAVNGGGAGGAGGCGAASPEGGHRSTMTNATPGGGGGSVGFLQIYTPAGIQPNTTGISASPPLRPFLTVPTH